MTSISIPAPAKLNLFLVVTGRRPDGFHELVSVVAPLTFGDTLHVQVADTFSLHCDDPEVPLDDSNLILRAARLFAEASGWGGGARFTLEKRIPVGAGLGGGSSDGVAALRALNHLAGEPLSGVRMAELAARLGSDCPLFLHEGPVLMRGRGERIAPLPASAVARLQGRRVLVFKPGFGVATAWAYGQLAAGAPATYVPAADAEARLAAWLEHPDVPAEDLLFNSMEPPVFAKFVALPVMLGQLSAGFGVRPRMSGSGSACFALLAPDTPLEPLRAAICNGWGESVFAVETALA